MKGFFTNIEQAARNNANFRHVLYTARHTQLVLMSLAPNEEIGLETHKDNDQFFRFEAGKGRVVVDDTVYEVGDGDMVIVPAGANHNVLNLSKTEDLKLYTLYSPPHHKDDIVRATKEQASTQPAQFDGLTTE